MPFNIEEFRAIANINDGFQKVNKYIVRFPIPQGMRQDFVGRNNGQSAMDTIRYLEFMCNSADLPGISLATRPILRYGYGVTEKKPMAPIYNDIMLTFLVDGNVNDLQFFHDWFRLIIRNDVGNSIVETVPLNTIPTAPYEIAYKGEYAVDGAIRLFTDSGHAHYEMIMREMYPVATPEMKMVWDPVQQMMAMVVMFTFFDWSIKRDGFDDDHGGGSHGSTNHEGESPIEGE